MTHKEISTDKWITDINNGLLTRLREIDTETYTTITRTDMSSDPFQNNIFQEDLIESAKEAWIQHCIQTTIKKKDWLLEQSTFTAYPSAKIWKKTEPVWKTYHGTGYTIADALTRAFIAASEEKSDDINNTGDKITE